MPRTPALMRNCNDHDFAISLGVYEVEWKAAEDSLPEAASNGYADSRIHPDHFDCALHVIEEGLTQTRD